ncbi:MAG: hypothetical protein MUP24_02990 [Gillisia sp.]|nr:hypothetical protein [Gillisia sp.]
MKNSLGFVQNILEHIQYMEEFLFEVTKEELSRKKVQILQILEDEQ